MELVRGYVFSRPFMGERVPQHVQNIVIRDYCIRQNLQYLLSATEYAMPNCHAMLWKVLRDLSKIDGIVAYSLYQLPEDNSEREEIFQTVIDSQRAIHFAVEGLRMSTRSEQARIEAIWRVKKIMPYCLSGDELRHQLVCAD